MVFKVPSNANHPVLLRTVAGGTAGPKVVNPAPGAGVCRRYLAKRGPCRKGEPGLGEGVSPSPLGQAEAAVWALNTPTRPLPLSAEHKMAPRSGWGREGGQCASAPCWAGPRAPASRRQKTAAAPPSHCACASRGRGQRSFGGATSSAAHALCRCAPPPPAGSAKVPELARPPARPSRAAAVTRRPAPVRTPLQRQVGARPPAGGRGGVCMYACGRGCCTTGPPFPRSAGAAFRCPHAESLKRVERRKNTTQNPKPSHFSPPPKKKSPRRGVSPPHPPTGAGLPQQPARRSRARAVPCGSPAAGVPSGEGGWERG